MAFADDLLEQAYHLLHKDGDNPKEASLRRAVSTAYYAVFHLLIDEAVGNWGVVRQRSILARMFQHNNMKKVCDDCVKNFYIAKEPPSGLQLKDVAQAFSELQQKRHTADYDNSFAWTSVRAQTWIDLADTTFRNWRAIRTTDDGQDFLLTLFLPKLPRE